MQREPLTPKQTIVYEYLKDFIRENGFAPSVREICDGVNLSSTSSVFTHLREIENKGYIKKDDYLPRTIVICDDAFQASLKTETAAIPIVGTVAAGEPILAEQNIESFFPIPIDRAPKGESFILKVKGDSMINIGIMNGDCVLVEATNEARNGDLVVALVEDSATVKTFYKENGYIRLQPENDTMDPIIVDDCTILGKVFGVYRFYK